MCKFVAGFVAGFGFWCVGIYKLMKQGKMVEIQNDGEHYWKIEAR
jgi:hypothetical protein